MDAPPPKPPKPPSKPPKPTSYTNTTNITENINTKPSSLPDQEITTISQSPSSPVTPPPVPPPTPPKPSLPPPPATPPSLPAKALLSPSPSVSENKEFHTIKNGYSTKGGRKKSIQSSLIQITERLSVIFSFLFLKSFYIVDSTMKPILFQRDMTIRMRLLRDLLRSMQQLMVFESFLKIIQKTLLN